MTKRDAYRTTLILVVLLLTSCRETGSTLDLESSQGFQQQESNGSAEDNGLDLVELQNDSPFRATTFGYRITIPTGTSMAPVSFKFEASSTDYPDLPRLVAELRCSPPNIAPKVPCKYRVMFVNSLGDQTLVGIAKNVKLGATTAQTPPPYTVTLAQAGVSQELQLEFPPTLLAAQSFSLQFGSAPINSPDKVMMLVGQRGASDGSGTVAGIIDSNFLPRTLLATYNILTITASGVNVGKVQVTRLNNFPGISDIESYRSGLIDRWAKTYNNYLESNRGLMTNQYSHGVTPSSIDRFAPYLNLNVTNVSGSAQYLPVNAFAERIVAATGGSVINLGGGTLISGQFEIKPDLTASRLVRFGFNDADHFGSNDADPDRNPFGLSAELVCEPDNSYWHQGLSNGIRNELSLLNSAPPIRWQFFALHIPDELFHP